MSPSLVPIPKSMRSPAPPFHGFFVLTLRALCRGDLQVALDLYRKAETYVPDNVKLKERWILFVIHVFLLKISYSPRSML